MNRTTFSTVSGHAESQPSSNTQESILFAISERERATFLPELPEAFLRHHDVRFFDANRESPKTWLDCLNRLQPTVLVSCWSTPHLPKPDASLPGGRLKYLCHLTGSVRHVIDRAFIESGGLVTNWGDAVGEQVAEHALLLALGALRNMPGWRSYIAEKASHQMDPIQTLGTSTLYDRRVGLHGFGRIARSLVRLLQPFRVEICAYSEGVPHEYMRANGVTPQGSLEELFSNSDVLFECEALNPLTQLSVTEEILSRLPQDAVFVNVGRGRVVDETALKSFAETGKFRIALDVVHEEPMTPKSGVFSLESALLSPHIGGPTADRYAYCGALAMRNLQRYVNRQPLEALMSKEDYDRST